MTPCSNSSLYHIFWFIFHKVFTRLGIRLGLGLGLAFLGLGIVLVYLAYDAIVLPAGYSCVVRRPAAGTLYKTYFIIIDAPWFRTVKNVYAQIADSTVVPRRTDRRTQGHVSAPGYGALTPEAGRRRRRRTDN